VHPVDPQGVHLTDCPIMNPSNHFLPGLGVAPHEAYANLQILSLGGFGSLEPTADGGRVCRKRFLGENVHAFFDGVLEVDRTKGGVSSQQHNITRPQAVDCLFVGVETDKLSFGRNVKFGLKRRKFVVKQYRLESNRRLLFHCPPGTAGEMVYPVLFAMTLMCDV